MSSMDGAMGAAVGAIGPILAVGLVSQVAQGTMKSVGRSYNANQRHYQRTPRHSHQAHRNHAFSMHSGTKSKKSSSYSIWKGTGF